MRMNSRWDSALSLINARVQPKADGLLESSYYRNCSGGKNSKLYIRIVKRSKCNRITVNPPGLIPNGLIRIQCGGLLDGLPYKIAALRAHQLKPLLEGRQAALFCHGIGTRIGREVSFALVESADYDIEARYEDGGVTKMVPVQLKELPARQFDSFSHEQVAPPALNRVRPIPDGP